MVNNTERNLEMAYKYLRRAIEDITNKSKTEVYTLTVELRHTPSARGCDYLMMPKFYDNAGNIVYPK